MEFEKLPAEKIFHFVAGIVPGTAILVMYGLRSSVISRLIIYNGFLGYKTKIAILLVLAFLLGNSATKFLAGLAGALGGVIGSTSFHLSKARETEVAPWRDRRWRTAAIEYLGTLAPNDSSLMPDSIFEFRTQMLQNESEFDAVMRRGELIKERIQYQIDDTEWASWYNQFHAQMLSDEKDDFMGYISAGLSSNMTATAISVLIGTIFVPQLRHIVTYVVCLAFALSSLAVVVGQIIHYQNRWATLSRQIRFLSGK